MKIKVGGVYKSNVSHSNPHDTTRYTEVWTILFQLEAGNFVGRCVRSPSEIFYREFDEQGYNGVTCNGTKRRLLPNRVKKESWGWKLRGTIRDMSRCVYLCSDEATADSIVGGNPRLEKAESIWYEDEE